MLAEVLDQVLSIAFHGRGTQELYLIVPHGIEVSLIQGILRPINQLDRIWVRTGDLIWCNPQEWAILGVKLPMCIIRDRCQFPRYVLTRSPLSLFHVTSYNLYHVPLPFSMSVTCRTKRSARVIMNRGLQLEHRRGSWKNAHGSSD